MIFPVPKIDLKLHKGQLEVFKNFSRFRVLVAGRRFGKCLAEDTLVWMADGSEKSIQFVVVGDMVLSMNPESMIIEPRAVVATECNGVRETLNLRTASRSIISTPHHPHFVNGKFMKVKDVKIGDLVGVYSDQSFSIDALSSRGNCNEYLPISYDDFMSKVKYKSEEKGKFDRYNVTHSRDMPSELRLGLNSWRKQNISRMSVKRYLAMSKWVDGYWDNFLSGNVRWEPVLEILSSESTTTYDIQVEGNHTFVANGIVTHNTVLAKVEIMRAAKGRGKKLIWYVAPTFSMAREIMWDDLIEAIPSSWIAKKHETRLEIRLINGTVIQLKGADRPDTLRGRGVDFVILDEFQDFRPNVWSAILFPTLTTTQGRMLCIGTPKSYNHFYDLYRKGQMQKNRRNASWWSWQFPTIMSPFFPPSEITLARGNLDPKTFRQEFEASFESMAGRVYYAFDRQKHIGNYPFNPLLPIIVGQDFNVDPMSSVIMQIQPNGQIWIVDEIHMPNSNTLEVCEELDRKYFRYKSNVTIYPDPAGANRASSRGETDLDIFRERGYRKLIYKKKHPLVSDRVATVNSMFQAANGDMNLFIDTRCLKTIESLEQTIYKAGTPTVDKSQGNEHMADAVGYPIHYLYGSRFKKMVGFSF